MEIIGPSLTLRYATPADAPALLELGSDARVTRFFSWGPYTSIEQPSAYIEGLAGERARGERLDLVIVSHGAPIDSEGPTASGRRHPIDSAGPTASGRGHPIGVTGLTEFNRRDRRAVVGTWLGSAYWGTGANRESKALIAHLAFRVLGLERLGAYADLDNPRSQRALERIGFEREGVLRHWHRHGSDVHDVLVYSWLKGEWACSPLADTEVEVHGAPPPAFMVVPPRETETTAPLSPAASPS